MIPAPMALDRFEIKGFRSTRAFPGYKKTFHGPMAVGAIGIPALRQACPHADAWLSRLEAI